MGRVLPGGSTPIALSGYLSLRGHISGRVLHLSSSSVALTVCAVGGFYQVPDSPWRFTAPRRGLSHSRSGSFWLLAR